MLDEILQAWQTNQRINVKLIDAISKEGMACTLSTRGGRNVVRQFAHLHNNRVWHLQKRAKAIGEGAHLFETKDEPGKRQLKKELADSAKRIETMFRQANDGVKGVRIFKRGLPSYLAYFVAHESHHRGNILLTLKQCGHAIDADLRMGIWDWDRI